MAKIKTIGNKKEILKKRADEADREKRAQGIGGKTEKQLNAWFKKHFSGLPDETRTGMEELVYAVWANANVTQKPVPKK